MGEYRRMLLEAGTASAGHAIRAHADKAGFTPPLVHGTGGVRQLYSADLSNTRAALIDTLSLVGAAIPISSKRIPRSGN